MRRVQRVSIVAPNYPPETNAAAQRMGSFAHALRDAGWQVTVLTQAPHHPQNRIFPGFDQRSPSRRDEAGISVVRIRPYLAPKDNLVLRLLSELLFCIHAFTHLLRQRPDVILASSPYMFLGPMALLASRLLSARFVWDVRDLTWLYPRAAGKKTFGMDRLLERIMLRTARQASALTTATEGLHAYFENRPTVSYVIPNGVNDPWLERLLAIGPRLEEPMSATVVYAGLFGYNHGLTTLIRAAHALPHVRFILVGDGPETPKLKELIASLELTNVEIKGHMAHDELIEVYAMASVLVSHVRANPIFRWTQPAKLWEYMATGRPVVHAGEGEVIDIIRTHELAVAVAPEQPQALATAIRSLLDDRPLAARVSSNARTFVVQERRRSVVNARLLQVLARISQPR